MCDMNNFSPTGRRETMRYDGGQVLVETMVALSMTVIGLIGILMVLNASIGLNRVITNQYIASYLASEGIEAAGYQLDVGTFNKIQLYEDALPSGSYVLRYNYNPTTPSFSFSPVSISGPKDVYQNQNALVYFCTNAQDGVVRYYSSGGASCSQPSATAFYRAIFVSYRSIGGVNDEAIVRSVVSWMTKGGVVMSVNVEDHFFNWRNP